MKYRLIETITYGDKKFHIQKKILFWWFDLSTTYCWYGTGNVLCGAILQKAKFSFNTEKSAKWFLDHYHKNHFKLTYKGNRIMTVPDRNMNHVYVNLSKEMRNYASLTTYEYAYNMDVMMEYIDRRNPTIEIKIKQL